MVLLAACGSNDGGGGSAGGSSTVDTRDVSDVGTVLVDSSGAALYFADEEKDGTVKCAGSCVNDWVPLTTSGNEVSAPSGVTGELGTVTREDSGEDQVTFDGAPLYTFAQDPGPGEVTGDGLQDTFNGVRLTWRAVVVEGGADGDSTPTPRDYGGGY
jgi:predicted lipoprotein with Yx(FWY)xxD motif